MEGSQRYYKDVREHLKALQERGKLIHIKREINKDTELMPLVRWQFRGLEEKERKAFLFENVIDVKGTRYTMPVTVGTLAARFTSSLAALTYSSSSVHVRSIGWPTSVQPRVILAMRSTSAFMAPSV